MGYLYGDVVMEFDYLLLREATYPDETDSLAVEFDSRISFEYRLVHRRDDVILRSVRTGIAPTVAPVPHSITRRWWRRLGMMKEMR